MEFLGARIQLNPRPLQRSAVALDVGILGHCLGSVRIERLLALTGTLADMYQVGFSARVNAIVNGTEKDLYHLPIPLHSSAEFDDIFPDARQQTARYSSVLGGDKAWLPDAIDDFFANSGERLWLVRVPENTGMRGFLPHYNSPYDNTEHLQGIACLLAIPSMALITFPDIERLQIPAQLPDIPRKNLSNPQPTFLPINSLLKDEPREPNNISEPPAAEPPLGLMTILREILSFTAAQRPDIQFLFTLPLGYSSSLASPSINQHELTALNDARSNPDAYLLRQVQFLFPYLRGGSLQHTTPTNNNAVLRTEALRSPAGVIAGALSASAKTRGVWRSIGGRALISKAQPYPTLDMQNTIALRERPGVGILNQRQGLLALDDERLVVPALHRNDYAQLMHSNTYGERLSGTRSAEVVRFLGYLTRQLQALGERLIFNISPEDPRPQLMLKSFFLNLYRLGALRGKLPEDAFSIRRASSAEGVIAFDIQIAPAFPIDKIVMTFINRNGEWATGLQTGVPESVPQEVGNV